MKKYRNPIFYVSMLVVSIGIIGILLSLGGGYGKPGGNVGIMLEKFSAWSDFLKTLVNEAFDSSLLFILQIIIILLFVRFFGWICMRLGQPMVVGEIIAGIALGPSVMGYLLPEFSAFVFPVESIHNISLLSEIGLVLFMFIVGMDLDLRFFKSRLHNAVIISHTCIAFLFVAGIGLSYFLFSNYPQLIPQNAPFITFALFMGIAMSITAFPVLARIVHERGLNKTALGSMAIACAAVDDITAWCLLAAVIAIAKAGSMLSAGFVILFALVYIIIMFKLVKPFLQSIADGQSSHSSIKNSDIGIFFIVLFISAYISGLIGIHPLFGAFLAGVVMPPSMNFRKLFVDKIEDISLVFLLPLFFVYTGLNTQIGLLDSPQLLVLTGIVVVIGIVGKLGVGALTAHFTGMNWRDSLTIGSLMNTRGLMQLVILNIGLELHIVSQEVFVVLVIMALATTLSTGPLLNLIDRIFKKNIDSNSIAAEKFRILAAFDTSEGGKSLLTLVNALIRKNRSGSQIDMLHVAQGNELTQFSLEDREREIFTPVLEKAQSMAQPVTHIFRLASNPFREIVNTGNRGDYNLLIVNFSASIFERSTLGRVLRYPNFLWLLPSRIWQRRRLFPVNSFDNMARSALLNAHIPTGIFLDRGLKELRYIFVPLLDAEDMFIGKYFHLLASNAYVRITLWDCAGLMNTSLEMINCVRKVREINPYLFQQWDSTLPIDLEHLERHDLLLTGVRSWKKIGSLYPAMQRSKISALLLQS